MRASSGPADGRHTTPAIPHRPPTQGVGTMTQPNDPGSASRSAARSRSPIPTLRERWSTARLAMTGWRRYSRHTGSAGRALGSWYLSHTRDRMAQRHIIDNARQSTPRPRPQPTPDPPPPPTRAAPHWRGPLSIGRRGRWPASRPQAPREVTPPLGQQHHELPHAGLTSGPGGVA